LNPKNDPINPNLPTFFSPNEAFKAKSYAKLAKKLPKMNPLKSPQTKPLLYSRRENKIARNNQGGDSRRQLLPGGCVGLGALWLSCSQPASHRTLLCPLLLLLFAPFSGTCLVDLISYKSE